MTDMTLENRTNTEKLLFNPEDYTLKEILSPKHSALLVVDVQNDFCDPKGKFAGWGRDISQMQEIVPHIQHLIDTAHKAQVPVIFTRGFEDVKFRSGPDLRRAVRWEEKDGDGSVNSESGTFGSEFYKVKPEEGDIVVEKHKWSAFAGKDRDGKTLQEILEELGVKTLVVTGVVAETCVETTVRDAYDKNYFVVIPRNSVGSNDQEQLETRMKYWEKGFIGDAVTEEVIRQNWLAKVQSPQLSQVSEQ
ncbi:MAG: cysteine hydrolase [Candidatus Levybacteria bacterium]|nr:cysteine hydrolase [Candidatus Levybacteria bacterium]